MEEEYQQHIRALEEENHALKNNQNMFQNDQMDFQNADYFSGGGESAINNDILGPGSIANQLQYLRRVGQKFISMAKQVDMGNESSEELEELKKNVLNINF